MVNYVIIWISIHAPAKGATFPVQNNTYPLQFQSTLPRRERLNCDGIPFICINFNPRSREGSDCVLCLTIYCFRLFQSTLPRRERRGLCNYNNSRSGFQSTLPRRERRWTVKPEFAEKIISIHAPAKGATGLPDTVSARALISIHAPAKGATAFINIFSLAVRLFFISSHQ